MTAKTKATGNKDLTAVDLCPTVPENLMDDLITASLMVPLDDPLLPHCRYGLKSIFWGLSGIGKSDQVKQAAARVNLECDVITPGQKKPEDFDGVIMPDGKGGAVVVCMLYAVRKMNALGEGVIFLDELSCAMPAVQGAMLTFINDGIVGDTHLAPGVRILCAANPPEASAGGFELEAPMSNRLAHWWMEPPSGRKWGNWLFYGGVGEVKPIQQAQAKLMAGWRKTWPIMQGLGAGFAERNSGSLHKQPAPDHPQAGFCWPSPRTWTWALRAAATVRALELPNELEDLFIESCVGEGAMQEFAEYRAEADLPDPKDVLINGWKIQPARLDKCYAIYNSIVAYTCSVEDKSERFRMAELAWKRIDEAVKKEKLADLVGKPARMLIRAKLGMRDTPPSLAKISQETMVTLGLSKATDLEDDAA
jgi:hypothetical protein